MGMTIGAAIEKLQSTHDTMKQTVDCALRYGMKPPNLQSEIEAYAMAIASLREKAEREKPPVTFGDQVRRMDDEHLAWQLTSIWAGGMGGVIKTIGGKPNVEDLMKTAYPTMLAEVKGPAKLKENTHEN